MLLAVIRPLLILVMTGQVCLSTHPSARHHPATLKNNNHYIITGIMTNNDKIPPA